MNRIKWLAIVLAIALLGYLGWQNVKSIRGVSADSGEAPQVFTMPVSRGVLMDQVVAQASLDAADKTDLYAPFAAPRVSIKVKAGANISKGDVLAVLDTSDLVEDIVEKEAAVRAAQEALATALRDAQFKPQEAARALRQAERKVADAEAALDAAYTDGDAAVAKAQADLARAQATLAAGIDTSDVVAARAAAETALQQLAAKPGDPALTQAYQQANARYQELEAQAAARAAQAQQAVVQAREALTKAEQDRENGIEQAEDALEVARYELAKLQLQQETGVTGDAVESARRALKGAQEALDAAQRKLEEATVRAPIDGVVIAVEAIDGQAVNSGAKLMTVGRLDEMTIQMQVDEADVAKLSEGMPLTLRAQAFSGSMFEGTIINVPLQAGSGQSGGFYGPGGPSTFVVTGQIKNPDNQLRIGMNAQAEIITTHREGVVLIGLEALRQEGGPHVFVLDGEVARRRDVVPGATNKTQIEIVEGLNDGDLLIMGPFPVLKELKDGQKVKTDQPPGGEPGPMPGQGAG